jgi:NADH dehydrogenase
METSPTRTHGLTGSPTSLPHVVVSRRGIRWCRDGPRALANQAVRVTLIDKHNFHTFLPLLYQVATAGLEPADVAYPIRTIFGHAKNVRVPPRARREVDHERNVVVLEDGTEISFDHLVVATGAVAAYFGISGASHYSMPLYSLGRRAQLRNRLLRSLEDADVAAETEPRSSN